MAALRATPAHPADSHPAEKLVVVAVATLCAIGLGLRLADQPVDCDELENLHCAWLWHQGLRPYADFFQNHLFLYWLVLRPIVAAGPPPDLFRAVFQARLVSWGIVLLTIAATGLTGAAVLRDRRAGWFAAAGWAIFCFLSDRSVHARPDMLMWLLLLVGTWLAAQAVGLGLADPRPNVALALVAGLVLGLACALVPKALFWCAGLGLALVGMPCLSRGRRSRCYVGSVLAMGASALVPVAAVLAWAAIWSDWDRFWFGLVTANNRLNGHLVRSGRWLKILWTGPLAWPMPHALAALLGAAMLAWRGPRESLVAVSSGLLGSVGLLAFAHGPWHQYHFPLLGGLTLLSALALAVLTADRRPWLRVLLAVAWLAPVGWAVAGHRPDRPEAGPGQLRRSLEPFQQVLDRARPDDTCMALATWHPVFLKDADPHLFAVRLFFRGEALDRQFLASVGLYRPRFLINCMWPWALTVPADAIDAAYTRLNDWVWERRPSR